MESASAAYAVGTVVVALYDFESYELTEELSFKRGDRIVILAEAGKGWAKEDDDEARDAVITDLDVDALNRATELMACQSCSCEQFQAQLWNPLKCQLCFHAFGAHNRIKESSSAPSSPAKARSGSGGGTYDEGDDGDDDGGESRRRAAARQRAPTARELAHAIDADAVTVAAEASATAAAGAEAASAVLPANGAARAVAPRQGRQQTAASSSSPSAAASVPRVELADTKLFSPMLLYKVLSCVGLDDEGAEGVCQLLQVKVQNLPVLLRHSRVKNLEALAVDTEKFIADQRLVRGIVYAQARVRGAAVRRRFAWLSDEDRGHVSSIARAFRDLFASEKRYISDLLVVVEEYLLPLRRTQTTQSGKVVKANKGKIVPSQTLASIFSSIEVILDAHQSLFCDLLRIKNSADWPFVRNVGDALLKAAPDFGCYRLYVEGFKDAVNLLEAEVARNSTFAAFLQSTYERLTTEKNVWVDLAGLLASPLNRITKYESTLAKLNALPLERLVGASDAQSVLHAYTIVMQQSEIVRKHLQETEHTAQIKALKRQLIGVEGPFELQKEGRRLVHDGTLLSATSKKKRRVILFSDCCIVATPKGKQFKVKYWHDWTGCSVRVVASAASIGGNAASKSGGVAAAASPSGSSAYDLAMAAHMADAAGGGDDAGASPSSPSSPAAVGASGSKDSGKGATSPRNTLSNLMSAAAGSGGGNASASFIFEVVPAARSAVPSPSASASAAAGSSSAAAATSFGNNEKYSFMCTTAAERDRWVQRIRNLIQAKNANRLFGVALAKLFAKQAERSGAAADKAADGVAFERSNSSSNSNAVASAAARTAVAAGGNNGDGAEFDDDVPELSLLPRALQPVARQLLEHAGVDGIFRESGSKDQIDAIMRQLDAGAAVPLDKTNPHTVAGVFKQFFRLLPEPLFPFSSYDRLIFLQNYVVAKGKSGSEQHRAAMREIIADFPEEHTRLLRFLCAYLRRFAAAENRMSTQNLAIVFAPITCYPREITFSSTLETPGVIATLKFLLDNEDLF